MRITRLALRDFRRYRELEIPLSPGLTIVQGPNEAGKTTIQRAIELALTRKVTSSGADIDGLRPWDAGDDARPVIDLDFEIDDDDRGLRQGTLEKSFRGAKGTVRLEVDGETITDPTLADQALAEITGIPSEAFFRSTASIRHQELADLDRDEATLRDRLQASISGADRGTSRAKRQLERALYDLNTKGAKNPGRLKVAEEAVETARVAVDGGEAALAQLEADRVTLSGARERRTDIDARLAEQRSMLDKARQAERLTAERASAGERFERYRQAVAVSEDLAGLQASHPSTNPLPVLEQAVIRLRSLDARIRELTAALAGEIEVSFDARPAPTWRPMWRIGLIALVLGLAVAGIATVLQPPTLTSILQVAGGVLAVIGLILAVAAWWVGRGDRVQQQLRDVEIDRRLRGRSEMEAALRQAELDTSAQLAGLELPDLAAAESLLAAEQEHAGAIDRLSAQLDGLVGKQPPAELPGLRDAAALEIEQKTHALEGLGPIAKEPRARERLEAEVRDLEAEQERARDDEANARARVEANAVDAEQVAGHAERLASWREQLAALQRRARVYDRTLREIEAAEQATMRTATRFLEGRMVGDIDRITGGRYRRVQVDDRTLDIRLFAPEKGDWVDVRTLSQGTLDLVYLAARLGLVRLVTGDLRPPLVLDDPFVTLDDERATRALALLKELARDFQVIYLTTSTRYRESADSVVALDGPTEVDDGAPEPEPALDPTDLAAAADATVAPDEAIEPLAEPAGAAHG